MTAEDPVEFNLPGINQVQVKEQINLTFAATLRSFLRQDPNIILVGEIRDGETAGIAVKAALTGHLVLSTLHTNDAPSSLSRLVNMGIEPFLVANSINLVAAQRLVRKVCDTCKAPDTVPVERLVDAGLPESELPNVKAMKGKGCDRCGGTGYKGRVGVFEIMEIFRAPARANHPQRAHQRAAGAGHPGRHVDAAPERSDESARRRDDVGRNRTRNHVGRTVMSNAMNLPDLLKATQELGGSDLHLSMGSPPQVRVDGHLTKLEYPDLTPDVIKTLAYSVLTDIQKKKFEETWELDLAFGLRGVGRFRCNVFNQKGAVGAVFRLIPERIRSLEELNLPPGAGGAGRSATRPGAGHRSHGQRQVHHAGRDDRSDQPGQEAPHPHH
jgi:hypothetical protein